jgi:hypothetical protein
MRAIAAKSTNLQTGNRAEQRLVKLSLVRVWLHNAWMTDIP